MDLAQVALLLAAGLCGGAVNSLAGGGSLITYPALVAVGIPPVSANVTNSLSVFPGYVSSAVGSAPDLPKDRKQIWELIIPGILGAITGTVLLLVTPASVFETIVPFFVITAALLLGFQNRIRALVGHPASWSQQRQRITLYVLTYLACVYGGYFNAALGVMLVACLALVKDETLARISALKNVVSVSAGTVAVLVYGFLAPVEWMGVLIMAPATILGGFLGAKLTRRLPQPVLRGFIVIFGLTVGIFLALT